MLYDDDYDITMEEIIKSFGSIEEYEEMYPNLTEEE